MVVKIGTTELTNILNWNEDEESTIPVKRINRKGAPTTQSDYFTRTPRRINIAVRCTKAEKDILRGLKNAHIWYDLCDYDCVGVCNEFNSAFVDSVWIEGVRSGWRGDEDKDYPWLVTLNLLCSTT